MKVFKLVLEKVYDFMQKISGILLLVMMAVAIANILLRAIFNYPIYGTFEIVCYLSLIMAAFAIPDTERTSSNIAVTIVLEAVPKKAVKYFKLFTDFIGMAGCGVIGYKLIGLAQKKFERGDYTADLYMPIYLFVIVISMAFILLTICLLYKVLAFFFLKDEEGQIEKVDTF
jgi:TRAP-type C4-dicarboxylate transport system permease small subunit